MFGARSALSGQKEHDEEPLIKLLCVLRVFAVIVVFRNIFLLLNNLPATACLYIFYSRCSFIVNAAAAGGFGK